MDATQLEHQRDTLLARRAEIEAELARLDDELRSLGADQETERGGLGNHLAEDASNVMEQERIGTISADLRDVLQQVGNAVERIDAGRYGICQRCGKAIAVERLEAFPYVAFCINCQSILEREQSLRARY